MREVRLLWFFTIAMFPRSWKTLEVQCMIFIYYINTSEIPSELYREYFVSSHVKRSPSLWLHNKSCLWKQTDLVFHWCLYNKQNITYSLMDMNFIFLCSTQYLTRSLRPLMRYRVDHSEIKLISTRGHVISSILHTRLGYELYLLVFNSISHLWDIELTTRRQNSYPCAGM